MNTLPEEKLNDWLKRLTNQLEKHPENPDLWELTIEGEYILNDLNEQIAAMRHRISKREEYKQKRNLV